MFVLTVDLTIKPEHSEEFAVAIGRQAQTSVAEEEGCYRFDVHRHETERSRFFLYEVYRDRAAFEAHTKMLYSLRSGETTKPWIERSAVNFWVGQD